MTDDPRYEVDDPKVRALLLELGRFLKSEMPAGWGFALYLFSYGEGGAMFYLSSAQRATVAKAMREWLARESEN